MSKCDCKKDRYGIVEHTPNCYIDRGLDRGPHPDHCPLCGSRKVKLVSWRYHIYACGSKVSRTESFHPSRAADHCIRRVIEQRDVRVEPLRLLARSMRDALRREAKGSPRWLLLDYWAGVAEGKSMEEEATS